MSKGNFSERVAKAAHAEIEGDAKKMAEAFAVEFAADTHTLSVENYLLMVKDQWPDPKFRESTLERVGSKAFIETFYAAHPEQPRMTDDELIAWGET